MGGRTKIGIGRTTRVKAVSMIAWGKRWEHCAHASFQIPQWVGFNFPFHEIRWVLSNRNRGRKWCIFPIISQHHIWNSQSEKKEMKINKHIQWSNKNAECAKKRPLTCLAAILEDPTTFPLSSSTSIPSDSSLCRIRPTLQMFALAEDGKRRAGTDQKKFLSYKRH